MEAWCVTWDGWQKRIPVDRPMPSIRVFGPREKPQVFGVPSIVNDDWVVTKTMHLVQYRKGTERFEVYQEDYDELTECELRQRGFIPDARKILLERAVSNIEEILKDYVEARLTHIPMLEALAAMEAVGRIQMLVSNLREDK